MGSAPPPPPSPEGEGGVREQAAALGRAMRGTPEYGRLRAAEKAVMAAPDSVKIAEALATLQHRKAAVEAGGGTLPGEESSRLDAVTAAAAADPLLRELWEAQQEFQGLVDDVRKRMLEEMTG